ncbi:MAG: hypothetical protein IKF51_04950 [Solobacterium sp.]|nr:hypothetical protein [Solobacterium sp.]
MNGKSDKSNRLFAVYMILAAVLAFLYIMMRISSAAAGLAEGYRYLTMTDPSGGLSGQLVYNDGMYGMIGHGIEIMPQEDASVLLPVFFDSALKSIDSTIVVSCLIYTLFLSVVLVFPLYRLSPGERKKQVLYTILTNAGLFILFMSGVVLLHRVRNVPFLFPDTQETAVIGVSLLSIIGGNCVLGALARRIRFRKLLCVLAVPACYILFLFDSAFEVGLYAPEYVESYSYIAKKDPRILDPEFEGFRYDEDISAVIGPDGEAYPPEQEPNPERLSGMARTGAYLYEIADPWSGSVLLMTEQILGSALPVMTLAVYAVKALCWIYLV